MTATRTPDLSHAHANPDGTIRYYLQDVPCVAVPLADAAGWFAAADADGWTHSDVWVPRPHVTNNLYRHSDSGRSIVMAVMER